MGGPAFSGTLIVQPSDSQIAVLNANSYLAVSDADTYHSLRNNLIWATYSTAQKTAALLYATRWLDGTYRWRGRLVSFMQQLGWPRIQGLAYISFFTEEGRQILGVPFAVLEACAEVALSHLRDFPLDIVGKPNPRGIKSVSAGGGVSVTFDQALVSGPTMDYVNNLVRDYYLSGGVGSVSIALLSRG